MATPEELARLAAGAQAGTTGVQAYEDAQKSVTASRDAAIAGLQHEITGVGGDPTGQIMASLRGQIDRPVQRVLDNLAAGQAQHQAGLEGIDARTAAYTTQAAAAEPVMRAEIEREYAGEFARAQALAAAQARGGGGGGGGGGSDWNELSDSELRTMGLGAAQTARDLRAQGMYDAQNALETTATKQIAKARAKNRPVQKAARAAVKNIDLGAVARAPLDLLRGYVEQQRARQAAGDRGLRGRAAAQQIVGARTPGSRDARGLLREAGQTAQAVKAAQRSAARQRSEASGRAAFTNMSRIMRQRALDDLAAGVGLSRDVQEQLVAAGVDPLRARGVFDATEERTYANAQRQLLGLPSLDEQANAAAQGPQVAKRTLSPAEVAQQTGRDDRSMGVVLSATYQATDPETGEPATDNDGNVIPPANVYSDAVAKLIELAGQGYDPDSAYRMLRATGPGRAHPSVIEAALVAALPHFDYAAAGTREAPTR